MASIPGLPHDLQEIPDERHAWLAWRDDLLRYRKSVLDLTMAEGPDRDVARLVQALLCEQDPAYFVATFGWIFEPRTRFIAGWAPFAPFAFQVDLLRSIEGAMATEGPKGDLVVEKSRDMGATWVFCSWALWGWLFKESFVVGLVSRNENLVDKRGSPDAMFFKVEEQLARLPGWMVPAGYEERFHRQNLKLVHPTRTNIVLGESTTTNAGRGGRATARINDEAAVIRDLMSVLTAQAASTDHRFSISSANRAEGPDFEDLVAAAKDEDGPELVRLDHWRHPFHDHEWLEKERARYKHDPEGFLREVLIDYDAGEGEWVYPEVRHAVPNPLERFDPADHTFLTCDPGQDDDTALVWVQSRAATGRDVVVEAYSNRRKPADFYASIISGKPLPEFGHLYTDEDHRLMTWTDSFEPLWYVGDPFGNHKDITSGQSFYERLSIKAQEIANRRIAFVTSQQKSHYALPERRLALREQLLRLDFLDEPGPKRVLEAIRHNKFPAAREGREGVAMAAKPVHDKTSHYTTAMEFLAVHRRALALGTTPRHKPTRAAHSRKAA